MPPFGVNLISTFGKPYSITYLAFSLADALLKRGVPMSLFNVAFSSNEAQILRQDLQSHVVQGGIRQMSHPLNLYVLPVVATKTLMSMMEKDASTHVKNKIHVTNLWWELDKLPLEIQDDLKRHDIVLTHSDFLAELARNSAPQTHVINSLLSWKVDDSISPDRQRFKLPEHATVFFFAFDADSELVTIDATSGNGRKNPFELVACFLRAFPAGQSDAHLVIRATHIEKKDNAALLQKLWSLTQQDSRIHLMDGAMQFVDVMALTASCDVYISLHRGEGLGLGMMEAMALGKPVIATAWSGNMSFMDPTNACLVRYQLEPLKEGYKYCGFELPPATHWAKPNTDDAVAYMRHLHRDKAYREFMGRNARLAFKAYQARAQGEKWIDALFFHWKMFDTLPKIAGKFSSP